MGTLTMPEDSLRCSPADLISVFRGALIAVLPTAEWLGLQWADDRQHRDWESLATALFDVCVRGPIEADASRDEAEYPLAPYDIDVASYGSFSWVSVTGPTVAPSAALVRLMTRQGPFDTVQVAELHPESLAPVRRALVPFDEADFVFVRRSKDRPDAVVRKIMAID